jgi:hypothetical protein
MNEEYFTVGCHGCGKPITIHRDISTVEIEGVKFHVPVCETAPRICFDCRKDRGKLSDAREALEKHLEDEEHIKARMSPVKETEAA